MSTFYSKNKAYIDVSHNEYVYSMLKKYPEWAKTKLTPAELKIFKSDSSIRTFANHGSLEKKNLILAKAGIHFITLYLDTNQDQPLPLKKFSELEKNFATPADRMQLIKSIIAGNMFATSSRDILSAAYLIAQNCHTEYYFTNMDYKRMFNAIEEVKLKNLVRFDGKTDADKVAEGDDSRTVVANFVLAMQEAENFIRVHLKLDWLDLNILLLLFIHRQKFVAMSAVYRHVFNYTHNAVRTRMSILCRGEYIESRKQGKITSYTIAEMGIMRVCELLEKVCSKALIL